MRFMLRDCPSDYQRRRYNFFVNIDPTKAFKNKCFKLKDQGILVLLIERTEMQPVAQPSNSS